MAGCLYVVATPIGNLEDITLRALRILRDVTLIAAEDTRRTRQLLNHFDIHTPAISFHDHSAPARIEMIINRLSNGDDVALVSDAGTPLISDPGYPLVRRAVEAGLRVAPIPGASSVLAALCVSGLPLGSFVYQGFLPRGGAARKEALRQLRLETRAVVIYEAPQRLANTLKALAIELGDRPVVVARELTKLHEEIWRGSLGESVERWVGPQRGEIVLVVGGAAASGTVAPGHSEEDVDAAVDRFCQAGLSRRDAARAAAEACGMGFRTVYRRSLDRWSLLQRDVSHSEP